MQIPSRDGGDGCDRQEQRLPLRNLRQRGGLAIGQQYNVISVNDIVVGKPLFLPVPANVNCTYVVVSG